MMGHWGKIITAILALSGLIGCASNDGAGAAVTFDGKSQIAARNAVADFNLTSAGGALRPGDQVRVAFTLVPELNTEQRVLPSGQISLPYVGLIDVNGKSIGELTQELKTAYAAHLREPDLAITVIDYGRPLPAPRIYVLGAVRDAGAFEIDTPITFLEAVALAGGMDERAKRNALAVIRAEDGELVATIYQANRLLTLAAKEPTAIGYLMPGDIVYVPQTGLSAAAEVSRQVQDLIGFSGYNGSFGYRFRDFDN